MDWKTLYCPNKRCKYYGIPFQPGKMVKNGSDHGQIQDESEKEHGQYHLRERRFGSFARTISLPATIKADTIQADYTDGVLTLRLPKAEEVKAQRIAVHTSSKN